MTTKQRGPTTAGQSGSGIYVRPDAAGKVLDEILRKPGPRGHTPPAVENKRRAIGQHNCQPGLAVVLCLQNNGCLEEYISALRALLNPGAVTYEITELARRVTATEREMGESVEDLLMGRADSHDYNVIRDGARVLAESATQLSANAAEVQYAAPVRRTA